MGYATKKKHPAATDLCNIFDLAGNEVPNRLEDKEIQHFASKVGSCKRLSFSAFFSAKKSLFHGVMNEMGPILGGIKNAHVYANFEGFCGFQNCILWIGNIMTPYCLVVFYTTSPLILCASNVLRCEKCLKHLYKFSG